MVPRKSIDGTFWVTYIVVDTFAEVGGSLYGTMKIRVRGVGDVNRKFYAGTFTGLIAGLAFRVGIASRWPPVTHSSAGRWGRGCSVSAAPAGPPCCSPPRRRE